MQMDWRRIGMVDGTVTRFRLDNLMEGQEHVVRIIARNREGESYPLMSDVISPLSRASEYIS